MASRKKQEEKHLQILKKLLVEPCNKECFECGQRGPTYVDVTIGSFVCTSCGGILRGINPPHRVKSISMTTFTPAEITFIQDRGNEFCKNVYLATYDERSKAKPDSRNDLTKLKYFMELKYEQKKWYISPDKVKKNTSNREPDKSNAAPPVQPLQTLLGKQQASQIVVSRTHAKPSSSPAINKPAVTQPTVQGGSAFADFDKVFGSVDTPFGMPAAAQQQPTFSQPSTFAQQPSFGQQSSFNQPPAVSQPKNVFASQPLNIMEPMKPHSGNNAQSNNIQISQPKQIANASSTDKYAALADLDFSVNSRSTGNHIDTATFSWGSSPQSTPVQQNSFMQPNPTTQHPPLVSTSSNPYQSNFQTNNVQQQQWMPQQQNVFQTQPANNFANAAAAPTPKNPFLAPTTAPPTYQSLQVGSNLGNGNAYGSWQPQAAPNPVMNQQQQAFSNSNPFAAPVNGNNPGQPPQNKSNPFMF